MQSPVQIQFKNMGSSEALEAAINKWVAKLERAYPTIMSCRVSIEAPSNKKLHGGLYHTKIDITLPGKEVVANNNSDLHHSCTDAYVSIRDAFKSAQRQLENLVKRSQEKVKSHEVPTHGFIISLFPENDSGSIASSDDREISFHRNSLLSGDFDDLTVGMEVRFVEHEDSETPRASSVRVIGKHHIV